MANNKSVPHPFVGTMISPFKTEAGVAFEGVFQLTNKEKVTILTRNLNVGDRFHPFDLSCLVQGPDNTPIQYRAFSPFRSKLGAAIALEIKNIFMGPGSTVLYIGDYSCGPELSHISDIVGPGGHVYLVPLLGKIVDPFGCLSKRSNITYHHHSPAHPIRRIDVIVSNVDDTKQIENFALNARAFLTNGGYFVVFVKTLVTAHFDYFRNSALVPVEPLHLTVMKKLKEHGFYLNDFITLEPYWERWGCIVGSFFGNK